MQVSVGIDEAAAAAAKVDDRSAMANTVPSRTIGARLTLRVGEVFPSG
jgi:hypothetical protein